jgi:hypothetical protein
MKPGSKQQLKGPERPTIAEQIISRIPLPFLGGCLILALIFSTPGDVLAMYLSTWDLGHASVRLPDADGWFVAGRVVLDVLLIFVTLWAVREMRLQVVKAKQGLVPLFPEGEAAYYKAFERVSDYRPPLIIAATMAASMLASAGTRDAYFTEYFFVNVFEFALLLIIFPILATLIWVYMSSNYGIYEISKRPILLKSYLDDRVLGLRPLGSLSLSLARPYFLLMMIAALWISFTTPDVREPPQIFVITAGLLVLGIVVFFLPLYGVHEILLRERRARRDSVQDRLVRFVAGHQDSDAKIAKEDLQALSRQVAETRDALALHIAERKIDELPTWPFDTRALSRLATSALTVTAILASRVVLTYLGL